MDYRKSEIMRAQKEVAGLEREEAGNLRQMYWLIGITAVLSVVYLWKVGFGWPKEAHLGYIFLLVGVACMGMSALAICPYKIISTVERPWERGWRELKERIDWIQRQLLGVYLLGLDDSLVGQVEPGWIYGLSLDSIKSLSRQRLFAQGGEILAAEQAIVDAALVEGVVGPRSVQIYISGAGVVKASANEVMNSLYDEFLAARLVKEGGWGWAVKRS